SNDIRSTYDEIDEEDEVFQSDYTEIDNVDSDLCEKIELTDETFNYKPIVDESEKPKIGSEYLTIDKCIEMYAKYVVPTGRVIVSTGRYIVLTGRVIVPVGRESKARTTLLQSIPDDHIADFHYMDDARDIWNAVKARFGGNAVSRKMRKSMLKQEFLEFRISEAEGLYKGYDRMQKILSQLNQLKAKPDAEEINLSATSTNKKMSYGDSPTHSSTTTYSIPSNSKTESYRTGNVIEDVLQSFVADTKPEQQLAYEDLEQIEKLDLEEMDLKWQMAMLSVRVHKFEQKVGRKIDFDKKESTRFNKQKVRCYKCQQRGHFARKCRSKEGNDKQRYSSFKIKKIGKKEEDSKALITVDTLVDWTNHDSESDGVIPAKEFGMIAGCDFGDAIKEGATKLYNLINGANSKEVNTTSENELGWDDSAFSVFNTNFEDVEGRPIFHRFAKTDNMKAVPPPLTRDYTSLSHIDLDESQMSYGTKPSTSCDPKCVPNDIVSCNDSDKSLEVNTNDFASSDSSVKSSEHQPNDSTSCASTSSVSTSVNEDENESNVGTPIKEPISVQDLPSFTYNSSDKTEYTSRTSCNKNGSFNKKACHFRKYASFVSKPQPVPNGKPKATPIPTGKPKGTPVPTGNPRVKPVPTGKPKVTPVPTGKPMVKPVPTGKPKVTPVPTGKPQAFTPVLTGRPNRPFSVPTDRGYTPSVMSGWWSHTASPMPHLLNPTSSYFQTYTPYVPTMYYNHMKYGGDKWATTVKPSAGCSWKAYRKGFHWLPKMRGFFYSGCSRSMTGNKEQLDDFHAFHGGKVTFGGGEGRITKGTIRTPTLDFENVNYMKELQQFNLFCISQICDKKNQVLFTDTECLVLSKDFQLLDDSMVVVKVPRKHNLYTINLNDLCPRGNLACLVAHASFDESVKWHRWMDHVNYKNMNKLVKGNLVRGLPSKLFKNGQTCKTHMKNTINLKFLQV
nr:ribonuclease H-like domain-containing protein [Tanacetum cinerariifolium]